MIISLFLATMQAAPTAPAQTLATSAAPQPSAQGQAAAEPDILIDIRAHADQVRWRQTGSISIRTWSNPPGLTIDENLSTGLPRPIPGQRTFRDIDWSLRAGASVGDGSQPQSQDTPAPAASVQPEDAQ